MEAIQDFEDMLFLLAKHTVRYLIIGGLAFIYHAKPRYTKDMDLWIDPELDNVHRANNALTEFGSPHQLDPHNATEILQIGVAPDRIDLLRDLPGHTFDEAWSKRITAFYGSAEAQWIDIDSLISIKSLIDDPRHQDDVRILKEIKKHFS